LNTFARKGGGETQIEKPQQRRIPACEEHLDAGQTGPQTGGRGDGQGIGDLGLNFFQVVPFRIGPVYTIHGYEFKVHAVVGQQPQTTMAWVFDGNGPFRTDTRFQEQDGRNSAILAHFLDQLFPFLPSRPALVKDGRKSGPNIPNTLPTRFSFADSKKPPEHLSLSGNASQGHPR
jgi:hypothetical protein